jgi:hypothetical protein
MNVLRGKVHIWCDAPSYPVVEGCSLIGIRAPEDVRWCRMSYLRNGSCSGGGLSNVLAWLKRLFGASAPLRTCSCGADLPALQPFGLLSAEEQPTYLIGLRYWQNLAGGIVLWGKSDCPLVQVDRR